MRGESARTIERRLAYILDGLSFPAARWQLITHAEYYGADVLSIGYLHGIAVRTYADIAAVVGEIVAGLADNPAVLSVVPGRVPGRTGPNRAVRAAS